MSEKVKQQLHFVAFLDLLGYKDFFKEKNNNVEKFLETINEALMTTIEETNKNYDKVPDAYKPQIKLFSDNILIAIRITNRNEIDFLHYLNLVRTVSNIQKTFITKYQLFLRGGIAKGKFYFGEALIKAYEMEQLAIFPKIKIDEKYIENIILHVNEKKVRYHMYEDMLVEVVNKERDGSYFVNYLPTYSCGKNIDDKFCINSIFTEGVAIAGDLHNDKDYEDIQAHKAALLEKIHEYSSYKELFSQKDIDNRRKVILKYMWSIDYHNQVCKLLHLNELLIHCDIKTDPRTLQPVVEVLEK